LTPVFESQELVRGILEHRSGDFVTAALGSSAATVTLNVDLSQQSRSTILERTPLTAGTGPFERREVPVRTLDEVVNERDLPLPLGIKIDVEGYERQVLGGASDSLTKAAFVIIEMSVAKRFEGAPTAAQVMALLETQGFMLQNILSMSWKGEQVTHFDGLFAPRRS
jgi:FkbM family methyltransferase